VKAAKLAELGGKLEFASDQDIVAAVGAQPGFIGPVGLEPTIPVIVDRSAVMLADFVCGGNTDGMHCTGVNWERDARVTRIADLRKVVEGDRSPDGRGTLSIARGIEVGQVFQLGSKYSKAMDATVLDEHGKARTLLMGCYGIGVSRIVGAAIEQNHDAAGIVWPEAMAPWQVAICPINPHKSEAVKKEAERIYDALLAKGVDVLLDDRGLRPGPMFADIELIGIPRRVVISDRGLDAGLYETRRRDENENRSLNSTELLTQFTSG
ncbi:MAG: His/Gly/Thr/Pro-type tRNA ligase C-terminal domain-containing protein, partial [Rhodanobacteraceae bacterium]